MAPGLVRTDVSGPKRALPWTTVNMPSKPRSWSRLSAVPVRNSPPSGNIGTETSFTCSQLESANSAARAKAASLVFIADHHARVRVERGRIREQDPERVVGSRRHGAGAEVPNGAPFRRVFDVKHLTVPGEQVRIVEAAPRVADARPLRTHEQEGAAQRYGELAEVVAERELGAVLRRDEQRIEAPDARGAADDGADAADVDAHACVELE